MRIFPTVKFMSSNQRVPYLTFTGAALLSLLLGGCANEKALLAQTQPLQDRIERIEQNLVHSNEAGLRAAEIRADALAKRQVELDQQLADIQKGQALLREQSILRDARMAEALAQLNEKHAALDAHLSGIENQLNEAIALVKTSASIHSGLQTRQDRDSAQGMAMAAEITNAAGRIDELNRLAQASSQEISNLTVALQKRQDAAVLASDAIEKRVHLAEEKLNTLSGLVQEALALAAKDLFLANGKEAFTVLLTNDKVIYPQNDPNLDPRDAAMLDELANKLGKFDQEFHLDIQGHTANNSTEDNNYNLGKARAEVVKRYLHEKKGISLSRMSAISYGANKPQQPAGGNNRRIFVRVLVLK